MKISNKKELDAAIIELEKRKVMQESLLIAQFKNVRESLSPLNIIKNGFKKLTEAPDIKEGLLKTAAGLGIGVLSKKLFLGTSHSTIKKLLSGVLELAVAKTTISNADKVKAYGISIYNNLFRKNHHHKTEN
jgi:hypothetical protein